MANRSTRRGSGPKAVILLYHRVAEPPSDPHLLCVTPRHFAEHLEVLRERGRLVRLPELAGALRDGVPPPGRSVAVTFDDGYADNLCNAKPLLERYGVPATVFVTTGYLDRAEEFWWDELERLLLQPGRLPDVLRLRVNGRTFRWELGEAACCSADSYRRHCRWNVLEDDPGLRQSCFRSLCRLLRPLAERQRQGVLGRLRAWAGVGPEGRPTHRALTPQEVVRLADGSLVEVGAHTVTHPMLAARPAPEQRAEIRQSKACLEEILGRPVVTFAYPYGSREDYTAETVAGVREAGFLCACSNFAGLAAPDTDRFQLPRVMVMDWDGEVFARRLNELFDG
jgi:peptidoglycan/xylan/chitin deacetylase (PgdA/CDA1 family)